MENGSSLHRTNQDILHNRNNFDDYISIFKLCNDVFNGMIFGMLNGDNDFLNVQLIYQPIEIFDLAKVWKVLF